MAKKKEYSSLYQRQLHGDQWFRFYQRSLRSLLYQMFEWKGLPETINPYYLEECLHSTGCVVFYDDPLLKHMVLKGTPKYINAYGDPIKFQTAMYQYHKEIPLYSHLIPLDKAKASNMGVLCKNEFSGIISSEQAIFLYSALLAENKQTKLISQNALKIPYVFKGKPEQVLSIKNIFEKIQANEPLIIEDEDQELLDKFQILNTNAPYLLDKIQADRMEIYNEFLTDRGINNLNINKKERTNLSEVNANNELIIHNRNRFLAPRQEVAKTLSKLWGMDITVDIRENLDSEVYTLGKQVNSKWQDTPVQ